MNGPRIGSLFSGYGGLCGLGVAPLIGGTVAWHVENDPDAARILHHHWPHVPNHGDITQVDWTNVEPVDWLVGGFPCTDVSLAGKRAGLRPDTRSGLWSHFAYAISILTPRHVFIENVGGLRSAAADCDLEPCTGCVGDGSGEPPLRALGAVVGDLSAMGYVGRFGTVRASDTGAPHGRERVFVLATALDVRPEYGSPELGVEPTIASVRSRQPGEGFAADAEGERRHGPREAWGRGPGPADGGLEPAAFCGTCGCSDLLHDEGGFCAGPCGGVHGHCPDDAAASSDSDGDGRESERGGSVSDVTLTDAVVRTALGTRENSRHLLPTPLASDGDKGGPNQRGGAGDLRLASAVHLLPTPQARDAAGAKTPEQIAAMRANGHGVSNLNETVTLLPTPTATPYGSNQSPSPGAAVRPSLDGLTATLATDWGIYAPAVRRWENLTRPAPAPTEPGRNGKPRLSPALPEWMLGLPAGHVTAVPGLSRAAQLRAIGNGVAPAQAQLALRVLLAQAGLEVPP